ncbi:MAG TPA: ATP-dependent helicase, partial [Methanoregulaceae archaeon]|nr:ATP-dependent helicase [Methanoregulaceae archaeon]
MTELNEQQKKAMEFLNGIAIVIAVPGSGKTLTMTRRICHLIQQHGIPPEQILGLTFTRNAAKAMRKQLKILMEDVSERVMLSTIHSFCHFLLREEGFAFTLLCGKRQLQFLGEILKDLRINGISMGMILRELGLAKNNLISVEEFRTLYESDLTMQKLADVFAEYEHRKRKRGLLDFDDLLLETLKMFEDEEFAENYRNEFRHVLVDEFQDTNPAQLEIVKRLLGNKDRESSLRPCGSGFFLGDDWQSIYAFNGASVGNILNFKRIFPQSQEFILSTNYRSTPQILKACQNLISHNERRIEKTLSTQNPDGEEVRILECMTEEDEAVQVAREIQELVNGKEYNYQDMAVLYRCNFQSRIIEERLSQEKIPYRIENGLNFYGRKEVKGLLDYLRVIWEQHSEKGDQSLKQVINVPNRYLGRTFLQELEEYAREQGISLYESLEKMPMSLGYVRKAVREFQNLLNPLMENARNLNPMEAIRQLREMLDYDRYVSEDEIPLPDDVKVANLNQLELAASRFGDIGSFLEHTETMGPVSRNQKGVHLMTIHKSKGLEFPVVFLVGLVEGIFPTKKGDVEEERR